MHFPLCCDCRKLTGDNFPHVEFWQHWAMIENILIALGGIGLFLLGMMMLTDGLRHLAGGTMRRALAAYTRTPISGAVTGAATTAVIQSSSATTVAAIGFVGAGLLSFPQALGVIFGANIGTTFTGWLVALLGFKLNIGLVATPMLLAGVLAKMFGNPRFSQIGGAIAGFCLLFIGIGLMQQGLAAFEGVVTPDSFPSDTPGGRFLLLLIGVAITLVTQSSSAGIATAMVALGAGTISFPQAAAMVIGMDVGTTFTAALAVVGGSTAMRQTGFAHVIYNLLTAVLAFALLVPYTGAVEAWAVGGAAGNAQIALVGFHTLFNTIGVILVLPFTDLFARFIIGLVPQQGPQLERDLDTGLLKDPVVAAAAATKATKNIANETFKLVAALLDPRRGQHIDKIRVQEIERAIDAALNYWDQIKFTGEQQLLETQRTSALHALDHLSRLHHRCAQPDRIAVLFTDHRLSRLAGLLSDALAADFADDGIVGDAEALDRLRQLLRNQRSVVRDQTIRDAAQEGTEWRELMLRLDGARWLYRVSYHIWRIVFHLDPVRPEPGKTDMKAMQEK